MRVVADPSLQRFDDGRTVAGGSPYRILRLTARGSELLDDWLAGKPVTSGNSLAQRLVRSGVLHPEYDTASLGPADVTVVVPVRGPRPGALLDALEGMRVLVVDDGSPTPISGAAVRHDTARGPGAARNAGWRLADTPLVAFLDADTVPEPGWLDPLLRHFEDPEVAAAAPRVRSRRGDSALERFERTCSPLDLGEQPGPVRAGGRISYVPTAALLVRTETLAELGGFDETLRFGEDVDLVWRLTARHQARYEPAAIVEHAPRPSWPALLKQRYGYGCSAGPLGRRHGENVAPVRLSLWSALAWLLVVLGRPRPALAVTGAAAVLLTRKLGALGIPARESITLAVRGNIGAARLLVESAGRAWAPLAIPPLLLSKRGRLVLACVAARHLTEPRELDPLRHTLARVAEDAAYGCGVLRGALRERSTVALRPVLTDRGGRSSVPVGGGEA
ncbi:mycofactocin biosynthesis glycosyltransferase MftF [Saccharopolyspora sp. TS4A08]|uniref:Mycofactocin biosynthesis glycosyltransferase MftF n=1 Tax=Saccharopolyspora ipomoeae TaxID=3042027 RepID=A0ABT6PGW9_9PSEU|nr:mycofactocin biosynthesis glycosyltransferase MftF [Saccharopolyspora sp. TS4A08]MDI2027222.1 mycofactocin biosynthesis glycosyltransferase MftF [Saccharopolyspora sp. TS4A08]